MLQYVRLMILLANCGLFIKRENGYIVLHFEDILLFLMTVHRLFKPKVCNEIGLTKCLKL